VHAATSRSASTADRCGAPGDMGRTIRGWGSRCAPSATTTPGTCCGSGTPRSCGAASPSPCNAASPTCAAYPSSCSGSGAGSPTPRSWSSRHGESCTSTSRSASTAPTARTAPAPSLTSPPVTSSTRSATPRPACTWTLRRCGTASPTGSAGAPRSTAAPSPTPPAATPVQPRPRCIPSRWRPTSPSTSPRPPRPSGCRSRSAPPPTPEPPAPSPHAVRIIETAARLAGQHESLGRLRDRYATLGYRGHPITKSQAYSVTFGQIRRFRRAFKRNPGLDPDADIREVLDDDLELPEGFERVSSWTYAGQGYLSLDQAAAAVLSAARSRTR
jgi:hypothetical protein